MTEKTYLILDPTDEKVEVNLPHLPSTNDIVYYKDIKYYVYKKSFNFMDNEIYIFLNLDVQ